MPNQMPFGYMNSMGMSGFNPGNAMPFNNMMDPNKINELEKRINTLEEKVKNLENSSYKTQSYDYDVK